MAGQRSAVRVADVKSGEGQLTPMMRQYVELKAVNPGVLLFYRMGDFYELFFEDAELASALLGITLTRRGQYCGKDIPMCGVPVHAAEEYLNRLIRHGQRVAIVEQTEDAAQARKRGGKSLVRRDVVRLVTPGTLTEETLLTAGQNNYLASLGWRKGKEEFSLSWVDISTGSFHICDTSPAQLEADLARICAVELLVSEEIVSKETLSSVLSALQIPLTPLPQNHFDLPKADSCLCKHFRLETLEVFGQFSPSQISAAGALVSYIEMTQTGHRASLSRPRLERSGDLLQIDAMTRSSLELLRTLRGESSGSLLDTVDRTVTPPGARLLAERLSSPLTCPAAIQARLESVRFFVESGELCNRLRGLLKQASDPARSLARLSLGRGGPRDLRAILQGIRSAHAIGSCLLEAKTKGFPDLLSEGVADLSCVGAELVSDLDSALAEELPLLVRDGGFIRSGYRAELDRERLLRDESKQVIATLQSRYAEMTEIRTLKVKHNHMLGYFIEVSAQQGSRLLEAPLNETFIHRQTMVGNLRFSTVELGDLEAQIATAAERSLAIERELFEKMRSLVLAQEENIRKTASALAQMDVYCGLAVLAREEEYVCPKVDDSLAFAIEGGRHPVVAHILTRSGEGFVSNSCDLGPQELEESGNLLLITGPNMAGKSTFLRQNALIAILAQMGSFVPARSAHIGVVDQLFSRVGASDDLARNRSTFMVEMLETATILNQAKKRALVILDEVGRGTATYDGMSIAWACVEYLHEVNQCRCLFATHFHELTRLSAQLSRLVNVSMKVREWNGDLVFLHEVVAGAADRSYGIQVAQRAGLPSQVIGRAQSVLHMLEHREKDPNENFPNGFPLLTTDPGLPYEGFPVSSEEAPPLPLESPGFAEEIVRALEEIQPDALSPREALSILYRLKQISLGEEETV